MSEAQFYQVLHDEPTVIYAKKPWASYFAPQLETSKPLAILAATNWLLRKQELESAVSWAKEHQRRYPQHYIEFLLDRDNEVSEFRKYGLRVSKFNPNALCDERVFCIKPEVEKVFPAVYVARPSHFKRLPLCREIDGQWLWITYGVDENPKITLETLTMPNVYAPQFKQGKYTGFIARNLMPEQLNRAKAGLCLSSEEGSMYTSAEYLLCGLPVVATPGPGTTRADLFHPSTSKQVSEDPFSVKQAVLNVPEGGDWVREITLELMKPHRRTFIAALRRAYEAVGLEHDPAYDMYHMFQHQLLFWQPVDQVLKGGGEENRKLLNVVRHEPRIRKLWCSTEGRYWEQPLPEPVV